MKTIHSLRDLRAELATARNDGKTVGFVPTMGALHEGHLSLVRRAKKECGIAAVSIFVNPLQFGPGEDFARYPRRPEEDAGLLASAGADLLYAP
ncbi:MAG TPA: pantoate--beta-alanine ligase, partial [Thermoanaerobaculia bacterium]|nr:pantoate--beta-alanine ligase [Thermoanaerobaculia bacterium]